MLDQIKSGEWKEIKTYYRHTENLKEVRYYENGVPNGEWKGFHSDGTLHSILWYKNGEIVREERRGYHVNGNLYWIGYYEDDMREGEWKFYNSQGKLKRVGSYKNDRRQGEWKSYRENGTLRTIRLYRDGELIEKKHFKNKR